MDKWGFGVFMLLVLSGCDRSPKSPGTSDLPSKPAKTTPAERPSLPSVDTFRVQGNVLHLFPVAKASFRQLPPSALSRQPDSTDSPAIAATQGRVHRHGSRLIFTLDNGRKTLVQDDTSDTDQTSTHYYWGELAKARQWVLFVGLWEGSRVLLVDQRTGQKTTLWGQPVASPDGKHVVSYSCDLAYNPTGLQFYQVGAQGVQQLWERATSWGPTDIRWLNNQAIAIEKQDTPDGPSSWLGLRILSNIKK